jgi:osmotically-inducible protein OsmY
MKKQIVYAITAATLALIPVTFNTGCAITRGKETAGAYAKDTEITAKIKADLYKDPAVKGTEVHVSTLNGVVQLSGFVDSQAARDRAEQLARSVSGVVDVQNSLLLPTGR